MKLTDLKALEAKAKSDHWHWENERDFIDPLRTALPALIEIAEAAQDDVRKEDRSLYIFQIERALAKLDALP